MPPPAFHYIKHGRAFGPISGADLMKLFEGGTLSKGDLVRVDGVTNWQPAEQVVQAVRAGLLRSVPPSADASGTGRATDTVFTQAPPPEARAQRGRRKRLKKCAHCGGRTSADGGFCHRCGGDLTARACRACTAASPARAKFCGRCGSAL